MSSGHVKWIQKEKVKAKPGLGAVEKAMDELGKVAFERMCKMFRTAHAIARHARPYTDFVWQCALDEVKGVDMGDFWGLVIFAGDE